MKIAPKIKIERFGPFWCVFVRRNGIWIRMRALYSTRQEARDDKMWWVNY